MAKTHFSIFQRALIKYRQKLYRGKTNFPYLSGDGFAALADFRVENLNDLENFSKMNTVPKIIFAKSNLVQDLLNIKKESDSKHILLAGNDDFNFETIPIYSKSVFSRIYLQNSLISDNKNIFTLPIGVENISIGINGLPHNLQMTKSWLDKKNKLMVGPFSPTNSERLDLMAIFSTDHHKAERFEKFLMPSMLAELMSGYRYVACPQGNGVDTHRFWEALYRGCVPVVLKNKWSLSLKYLNIPFLQLAKWQDFESEIKKFEKNFYDFNPLNSELLWLSYWRNFLNNN